MRTSKKNSERENQREREIQWLCVNGWEDDQDLNWEQNVHTHNSPNFFSTSQTAASLLSAAAVGKVKGSCRKQASFSLCFPYFLPGILMVVVVVWLLACVCVCVCTMCSDWLKQKQETSTSSSRNRSFESINQRQSVGVKGENKWWIFWKERKNVKLYG